MAFLENRKMINDLGFEGQENNTGELITCKRNLKRANEIHLKFVDDLTLAEAINLPKQLVKVPDQERTLPDNFHARTGHALPPLNSKVAKQLERTKIYAKQNQLKLNHKKTKIIVFNPCRSLDFIPNICLDNQELEVVEEIRMLGLTIRSDMKWVSNTENMVKKANKRLWLLRRLKYFGANNKQLVEVYTKQIRSILELAAPAWQGSITQSEKQDLERIQKSACHIILGHSYLSYNNALKTLNLETLDSRRHRLTLNFALKSEKHTKFKSWFYPTTKDRNTRAKLNKYCDVRANHTRFAKSPLSIITNLLNMHYNKT